ncbi:hypothetical protein HMPREF9623_00079 [Stomatobaculum longum]|jgi:hypothetical protein|uniref:CarD-like/TRCF RNAP-interacting domain-containing protein n=1 Tax=Stomatobaculum longum TaxID=796942 RepID=A0AA36Y6U8_9FIRM|nr:CarD family transcriptional regulator [Stomatobaculum longum]EHO18611.1 hypothetical protein HMPREF9623_00079 [Stomatobaculum longum]
MYQLNDIVVYESSGVCRICDIQELSFSEDTAPNTYYILAPLFSPGDVIYTPVNSTKTVFRPVISREEALETIRAVQGEEIASYEGMRSSELEYRYRRALQGFRWGDLLRLLRAINRKMQRARRSGKKGSEVDRRFQRRLDFLVTGELAVALNVSQEETRSLLERELELV